MEEAREWICIAKLAPNLKPAMPLGESPSSLFVRDKVMPMILAGEREIFYPNEADDTEWEIHWHWQPGRSN